MLEGKCTLPVRHTIENVSSHILSNLNYCLECFINNVVTGTGSWLPNRVLNLTLLKKQVRGFMKTLETVKRDLENIFPLDFVKRAFGDFSLIVQESDSLVTTLFGDVEYQQFLSLKTVIHKKQTNVNVITGGFFNIKPLLKNIENKIKDLMKVKKNYCSYIKGLCKKMILEQRLTSPLILISLYYKLKIAY